MFFSYNILTGLVIFVSYVNFFYKGLKYPYLLYLFLTHKKYLFRFIYRKFDGYIDTFFQF